MSVTLKAIHIYLLASQGIRLSRLSTKLALRHPLESVNSFLLCVQSGLGVGFRFIVTKKEESNWCRKQLSIGYSLINVPAMYGGLNVFLSHSQPQASRLMVL